MSIPPWADTDVSQKIAGWCAQGEGQKLEFKEDFPQQGHDLAQEVAAIATSRGGVILIGVYNNGTVKGLAAGTEEDRDAMVHRAQGIIHSGVRPAVKYEILQGCGEGRFVLVIRIDEKQDYPVFYQDYRPYIRDGKTSRRAEPHEVQERVWSHGSSDYRRQMEQLRVDQMANMLEASRKMDELSVESQRKWAETMQSLYRI